MIQFLNKSKDMDIAESSVYQNCLFLTTEILGDAPTDIVVTYSEDTLNNTYIWIIGDSESDETYKISKSSNTYYFYVYDLQERCLYRIKFGKSTSSYIQPLLTNENTEGTFSITISPCWYPSQSQSKYNLKNNTFEESTDLSDYFKSAGSDGSTYITLTLAKSRFKLVYGATNFGDSYTSDNYKEHNCFL